MKLQWLSLILGVVCITACVKNPVNTGYITEFEDFSAIEPGVTTQQDVVEEYGSPSATSDFGEPTWYYVGTRSERIAFLAPEVRQHKAYRITFNEDGTVRQVEEATEANRRDIAIVNDETRTEGNEMTVLEQLIGNLGRFNPNQAQGGMARP